MRERPDDHDADHDAIRALLGDLSDAPLPPEVGARLDAVLADLATEDRDSSVVDLAGRDRGPRRRWAAVLAAATVASVVGLGVVQVLGSGADSDSATTAADSTAGSGVASDGAAALFESSSTAPQALTEDSEATDLANGDGPRVPLSAASAYVVPTLRTATFAVTAPGTVAVLEGNGSGPAADAPGRDRLHELTATRSSAACPVPDLADGDRAWRVRLDRRPGVLVARRTGARGVGADERVLEGWHCRDLIRDRTAAPRVTVTAPGAQPDE